MVATIHKSDHKQQQKQQQCPSGFVLPPNHISTLHQAWLLLQVLFFYTVYHVNLTAPHNTANRIPQAPGY
jgi:hypothetical protein